MSFEIATRARILILRSVPDSWQFPRAERGFDVRNVVAADGTRRNKMLASLSQLVQSTDGPLIIVDSARYAGIVNKL